MANQNKLNVSVVIPVYNEEDKIVNTLLTVHSFLLKNYSFFEIIVVDDGSLDNTVKVVENLKRDKEEIKLIKNLHKGKGYSVWSGMQVAVGLYICMCDADLATPITELTKFCAFLQKNECDIAIASRALKDSKRLGEPIYRNFIGRIFNFFVQAVALPGIKDSQCGFKVFQKDVAKDIFNLLKVYGIDSKVISSAFFGAFDVEVLYLARKKKYRVKEIPVVWSYVKTTRFNFVFNTINMAKDVIRVRLNDWRGYYN